MGLKKSKTTTAGMTAEYWRIIQLNMNYDRADAVCTLALYQSKADRDLGTTVVETKQFDLADYFHGGVYSNGEDIMKNVSLKEAYKAVKKMAVDEDAKEEDKKEDLAFFADAVDQV